MLLTIVSFYNQNILTTLYFHLMDVGNSMCEGRSYGMVKRVWQDLEKTQLVERRNV